MLVSCYTQEQLNESKLGQLEMAKKAFRDIIESPSVSKSQTSTPWKYDISKCSAFKSMLNVAPNFRFKMADIVAISIVSLLIYFLS